MARGSSRQRPGTRAEIQARIAQINQRIVELDASDCDRLGRIALAAGLAEVDVPDAELEAALRRLAATFPDSTREEPAQAIAPGATAAYAAGLRRLTTGRRVAPMQPTSSGLGA
jgi:hypothetical protein